MRNPNDGTVAGLLSAAAARMGADGRAQAERLLCHVLACTRAWLIAHADDVVAPDMAADFADLVARRARGEPLAHILGEWEFWSLSLRITPDVLIPRADTELLVERALALLPTDRAARVADLGTGSGAVALAIASERSLADVVTTDAGAAALDVARGNARSLGLESRLRFALGDWFEPLAGERYDLIVSNPPYLAPDDPHLDAGDLRFEPRSALVSGDDGFDAIRHIVAAAPTHLCSGGWLLLEHGWEQGAAVRALLAGSGYSNIATWRDIEHRERVSGGSHRSG